MSTEVKALASSQRNSPFKGLESELKGDGEWEWSYDMWVLVDIMEIQGQDVVLAANVHAVMVFIHT